MLILNSVHIYSARKETNNMGKKLNKLLSVAVIAGAGAYAYKAYTDYKKEKMSKMLEDHEMTEEKNTTREMVDFFKEKKDEFMASREYVTLNEKAQTAKEILIKTVSEAAEKFAEKAEEIKDGVGVVADSEKDSAEDFEFEDFDNNAPSESDDSAEAQENTSEEPASEDTEDTDEIIDEM